MTEELKEKLKAIADHYGYSVQAMKLAEEGAEYGAVLFKSAVFSWMKSEGHPDGYVMKNMEETTEKISEERADVLVVAAQLFYLLEKDKNRRAEIEALMLTKADRQLQRIQEEKEYVSRLN